MKRSHGLSVLRLGLLLLLPLASLASWAEETPQAPEDVPPPQPELSSKIVPEHSPMMVPTHVLESPVLTDYHEMAVPDTDIRADTHRFLYEDSATAKSLLKNMPDKSKPATKKKVTRR